MRKILIWATIIIILIVSVLIYWNYYNTYSEGNRTGVLQKFSKKGNIFKTYEGDLIMSSISSTSNVPLASEKFHFSVVEDSIAKIMFDFEGQNVTVQYKQKRKTLPWRGETTYIVDGVRVMKK